MLLIAMLAVLQTEDSGAYRLGYIVGVVVVIGLIVWGISKLVGRGRRD